MRAVEHIFPLAEAAFVLGEPVQKVKRELERNKVEVRTVMRGGRQVRALGYPSLVFLAWARSHEEDLTPALWRKCYDSVKDLAIVPAFLETDVVRAPLKGAEQQISDRVKALNSLESGVERNAAGDVVLKGTDIEVHRIGALRSAGVSIEDVLQDYPSLKAEQVTLAEAYSAAHPKAGRPYPKLTAKAALRKVRFGALDLDD